MRNMHTEGNSDMPEKMTLPSENAPAFTYAGYLACGGRIDEENYLRVMKRAEEEQLAGFAIHQTKIAADLAGISLDDIASETGIDPRVIYGILRHDESPPDVLHHHTQMSDQMLLVEALRMLEQSDAVAKVIAKHPSMNTH